MKIKQRLITITLIISMSAFSIAEEKILIGDASWYGEQFHGRKTASGEIFDMHKLTAAHKTLAFGTRLEVTNLDNGKSITVRVNDRGPFKGQRILDVSKEAARELGFLQKGLTRVSIRILTEKAESTAIAEKKAETRIPEAIKNTDPITEEVEKKLELITPQEGINSTIYLIQVQKQRKKTQIPVYKLQLGVYSNALLASKQHKALESIGIHTAICLFEKEESLYRILTKQTFSSYKEAHTAKEIFHNKYKIPTFIVQF